MERLQLTEENIVICATKAADVLRAGGVVLYPTDTLYGLGTDALSDEAVAKVKRIKGRDEKKPIHAIVADIAMAQTYGEVEQKARAIAEKFGGKVTLVVKKRGEFNTGIFRGIPTFGFRILDNEFCIEMLREFGKPITATSANRSGETPERHVKAILDQLQHSHIPKYVSMSELVIDAGELPQSKPSTVVDFSGAQPVILREGAVPTLDIRALLEAN